MKSVWIIKQYGSTPSLPGGCRQYDIAKHLAEQGLSVTYILSSFHHMLHQEVQHGGNGPVRIERSDGISVVWIKSPPYARNDWRRVYNLFDFSLRLYLAGKKLPTQRKGIKRPDAILAFNLPLLTPLVAYRLARFFNAKFFLEVGDIWPQTLIDMGKLPERGIIVQLLKLLERHLYQKAEKVITPLPHVTDYLDRKGFQGKGVWIGSSIEIEQFPPPALAEEQHAGDLRLMYLGAHGPANGLDRIIETFRILQEKNYHNIKLELIGEGSEKATLQAIARDYGLRNVEFKEAIPKNKVPLVAKKADAFLFSLQDLAVFQYGINPNKLVDYLCCGKPIVFASMITDNLVTKLGCGLATTKGTPEDIADKIIQLSQMTPEERFIMGKKGRLYVEQYFDSTKLTKRLINALNIQQNYR